MLFSSLVHNPTDNAEELIRDYLEQCQIESSLINTYLNPPFKISAYEGYANLKQSLELLPKYDHAYVIVDCDVDGICSAAIIITLLKRLGINYQPLFHKGKIHGLDDVDIIETIKEQSDSSTKYLLIIPDASGSKEQCEKVLQYNIGDILVLDHHEILEDNPYIHMINNQCADNVGVDRALSGAYVTWQFVCAYCDYYNLDPIKPIDLVGLSVLSDVCDLRSLDNRIIVKYGLDNIQNDFFKALVQKFVKKDVIVATDVVWSIVPKINASIRSGNTDIQRDILSGFLGTNERSYDEIIKDMQKYHRQQQQFVKTTTEKILPTLNKSDKINIVVAEDLATYTGLIAGKIADVSNKPTIVVQRNNDDYIGSVRSPFPILHKLNSCKLFEWNKGHAQAHGTCFKVNNISKLKQWCDNLNLPTQKAYSVCAVLSPDQLHLLPRCWWEFQEQYKELWGEGIPAPDMGFSGININTNDIQLLGKNKTTIKFTYNGIDYIRFFCGEEIRKRFMLDSPQNILIDLVGKLNINTWQDTESFQVVFSDFEITKVSEPTWEDMF